MHALFFEVQPKPGHEDAYFGTAAALKPQLQQYPGLHFLDRYRSQTRSDTILSYQHWRDDAAIVDWRRDEKHKRAQSAGRDVHFADYALRICRIVQAFTRNDENAVHLENVQSGALSDDANYMIAVESRENAFPRGEAFSSVNREGVYVSLLHAGSSAVAEELINDAKTQDYVTSAILCAPERVYGMFDRDQAPAEFKEPA